MRVVMRGRRVLPMPREFDRLAIYNAEVARGIAHTPEWDEQMAHLQRLFDEWARRTR